MRLQPLCWGGRQNNLLPHLPAQGWTVLSGGGGVMIRILQGRKLRFPQAHEAARSRFSFLSISTGLLLIACLQANRASMAADFEASEIPAQTVEKQVSGTGTRHNNLTPDPRQVEASLKELRKSLSDLKKISTVLLNEFARTMPVPFRPPNVVGQIVIPPMPMPTGMLSLRVPPRNRMVDRCVADMSQIMIDVRRQAKHISVSKRPAELSDTWTKCKANIDLITGQCRRLQILSTSTSSPDMRIARQAMSIHDESARIDHPLKQMVHLLKKQVRQMEEHQIAGSTATPS
jgi:hypothetical protein